MQLVQTVEATAAEYLPAPHSAQVEATLAPPASENFRGNAASSAELNKCQCGEGFALDVLFHTQHAATPISPSASQQATATARRGRAGAGAVAAPSQSQRLRRQLHPRDPLPVRRRRRPRSTRAPESPLATSCLPQYHFAASPLVLCVFDSESQNLKSFDSEADSESKQLDFRPFFEEAGDRVFRSCSEIRVFLREGGIYHVICSKLGAGIFMP